MKTFVSGGLGNMKKFNVTGLCVPQKHYMVDLSEKIGQIRKLIDDEHYFTINRARQYGKTTTLHQLKKAISQNGDYICASLTFELMSTGDFDDESTFCDMFLSKMSEALELSNECEEYSASWYNPEVTGLKELSRHITKMCKNKKLVLMIDEVDNSTNNRLFLHFLGMLRAKFLSRQAEEDHNTLKYYL